MEKWDYAKARALKSYFEISNYKQKEQKSMRPKDEPENQTTDSSRQEDMKNLKAGQWRGSDWPDFKVQIKPSGKHQSMGKLQINSKDSKDMPKRDFKLKSAVQSPKKETR